MKNYILLLLTLPIMMASQDQNHMRDLHPSREKRELLVRSKRRWVLTTIDIIEEDKGPYPKNVTRLFNDQEHKYDHQYKISGHGVDEEPLGVFTIDPISGQVYAHQPVDREKYPTFHIKFDVTDENGDPVDRQLSFDVDIMDINDNAPKFTEPVQRVDVPESHKEGRLPASLTAIDDDDPNTDNAKISMTLVKQEPATPKFGIQQFGDNYQLTFTGCLDYEKVKEYKVFIEAKDHGKPKLSSTATVIMNITDSNTYAPVFKQKKFEAQVLENTENQVVLRLPVTDKDSPGTSAWKAKYSIIKGDKDGNYKIETDPVTNEGILTLIKAKDYEETTKAQLVISVENEEPLFACGPKGMEEVQNTEPQTTDVTVTVIDTNDAPVFTNDRVSIHEKEEEEPGKVLYKPTVTDVDSDINNIRYVLARDPEKWMSIDPKTGEVKTVKKMDRESPHVNNSIYTVIVHAIDDGKPPATGTGTLLIHLTDVNDHAPALGSKKTFMCGNKETRVDIEAQDLDESPFSGPFSFHLRDAKLKKLWKLDPDTGMKATLVSLKPMPYENYTIPLTIEDQQGKEAEQDLLLEVCDCATGKVCKRLKEKSSALGGAGIAALFAGILALLLLCLALLCNCKGEELRTLHFQEDGNQTLIKYNEEGGSAEYKAAPPQSLGPNSSFITAADVGKTASAPDPRGRTHLAYGEGSGAHRSQEIGTRMDMDMETDGGARYDESMEMIGTRWSSKRSASRRTHFQSLKTMPNAKVSELLEWRIEQQKEDQLDFPRYQPQLYEDEGNGSKCHSLDKLSLCDQADSLNFLQHLGPKFNNLDAICRQAIKDKNLKL